MRDLTFPKLLSLFLLSTRLHYTIIYEKNLPYFVNFRNFLNTTIEKLKAVGSLRANRKKKRGRFFSCFPPPAVRIGSPIVRNRVSLMETMEKNFATLRFFTTVPTGTTTTASGFAAIT